MEKNTRISIITVVFNDELGLKITINSVVLQKYNNIEYIIIDGGSTDNTVDVIKNFDQHVDYWISETDKGIYDAMNKGVRVSSGDYIYFLNAGDYFYDNNVLQSVSDYLNKDYDLVYGKVIKVFKDYTLVKQGNIENMKWGATPPHQASFVKKDTFAKLGYFDTSYKCSGDRDFFCKFFKKNRKYKMIDDIIAYFITGGMSSNTDISHTEQVKVLRKHFGAPYWQIHYLKNRINLGFTRFMRKLGLNSLLVLLIKLNNDRKLMFRQHFNQIFS